MEQLIVTLRRKLWANYFIVFTRMLIGFAFIPSGLTKAFGEPFTVIPTSNPIGYFFDALHHTGIYWYFLGFSQLVAGFLLMSQRYTAIAALMFLGIITNIFLITVGLDFTGTKFITGLMLLANISLIVWDWQRIKLLFVKAEDIPKQTITPDLISGIWSTCGIVLFVFFVAVFSLLRFLKDYFQPSAGYFLGALSVGTLFGLYILVKDFFGRNR
jgi:uncharacterized membrane protein YphA (DoxX/SURF4 family)